MHLRLEETSWDFGDVPRCSDLVHEFVRVQDHAAGDPADRHVVFVSEPSFSKRPVAPADSGVIRIVYEPHKSEPGTFNKVIQIYSESIDGRDILTVKDNSIDGEMPARPERPDETISHNQVPIDL